MNKASKSPIPIRFFKLGGTWDMIERKGRRVGTGKWDDDALKNLQNRMGLFKASTRAEKEQANKKIAEFLLNEFQNTKPEEVSAEEHFSSWAVNKNGEKFADFATGSFTPLFSGDSSLLTISIIAPLLMTLLNAAKKDPTKPILGAQGTDTADLAILNLYDVFTYDTDMPPLILTGSNNPHLASNSDAPQNFVDLAKLVHINLSAGAYWVFHGNLYEASDLIKIDPGETRLIEKQSTHYSPHQHSRPVASLVKYGKKADWKKKKKPKPGRISSKVNMNRVYIAYESVFVIDLANQNPAWTYTERIFDPKIKAVVIAAHSFGNVDNEIRQDLVKAARMSKIVVVASRSLIGVTNESYAASLLSANNDPQELKGSGKKIIAAHKLSKTTARTLVTRAIIEGLNQAETQNLFDNYAKLRKMY